MPSMARARAVIKRRALDSWHRRPAGRDAEQVSTLLNMPSAPPQWVRERKFIEVLRLQTIHLHERGKLNLDEHFVGSSFANCRKGLRRRSH